jgi:hypothetical protein
MRKHRLGAAGHMRASNEVRHVFIGDWIFPFELEAAVFCIRERKTSSEHGLIETSM